MNPISLSSNHPKYPIVYMGILVAIKTSSIPIFRDPRLVFIATEHCEGRAEEQQPRGGQGPRDQLPSQSIADQKLPKHPIPLAGGEFKALYVGNNPETNIHHLYIYIFIFILKKIWDVYCF